MTTTIEMHKEAIREDVCRRCVCFEACHESGGICVHEKSGTCPIFMHLAEVVEIVRTVRNPALSPYIDALRQRVCCKCSNQDESGFCRMRDNRDPIPSWCMLDSYLSLVISSVERVLAE